MKPSSVIILFVLATLIGSSFARDYVFGVITGADKLVERISVNRRFMPGRVTTYEQVIQAAANINGIKVIDHKGLKDATVTIAGGAIGTRTLTLRFTSARGAAIKCSVEVYTA